MVPHPRNRGGDPVKSLRTMQLNGTIVKEGYDTVEANTNAVAVEEKPALAGGSGTSSQEDFAKKMSNGHVAARREYCGDCGQLVAQPSQLCYAEHPRRQKGV